MTGFLCTIPVIANLLSGCAEPLPLAAGYVEGDYVLVAPVENARIEALAASRGDRVEAGRMLAVLERRDAEIAVAQGRAALAQAQSQLADLKQGRRPEELAVLEAAVDQARAQLANLEQGARPEEIAVLEAQVTIASADKADADRNLARIADLARRGIATQAQLDAANAGTEKAAAAVEQAEANLAVARLPARHDQITAAKAAVAQADANLGVARLAARADQIAAAEAQVAQAEAALEQAQWRLGQRQLVAPASGSVSDVIRNAGELAGPQAPVLSFLPDNAVKLRLYVPEPALVSVKPGTRLTFRCDGCGDGMTATVTYVATDPEFTPPVIYSLENRQKLVWLVEAKPDDGASRLKPGQIVDADLADAAK